MARTVFGQLNLACTDCRHHNHGIARLEHGRERHLACQKLAEQNSQGARKAGEYLAQILPDAACYGEAMELYKEIKSKVLDDWKFEMKIYQDGVDIEKERIKAMRDIGVAWGEHQPKQTYQLDFLPAFRR